MGKHLSVVKEGAKKGRRKKGRRKKGEKKRGPRQYTAPTAALKCIRRVPILFSAILLWNHLPKSVAELLDQWDLEDRPPTIGIHGFKLGRDRYDLKSLFVCYVLMRAREHHSESDISQRFTPEKLTKKALRMPVFNHENDLQKSPHPDRFHFLRKTLLKDGRLEILQRALLVEAMMIGAMTSKLLFGDGTVIDLCRDVNGGCKKVATCPFILGTGKPARGCLKARYPDAEYCYKKGDEPYLGFERHVEKDWRSGLTVCSKTTGAKKAENHVLVEMIEESEDLLRNWKYQLADKGYDDRKVYEAVMKADLIPIISIKNQGKAQFFSINKNDRKNKFRVIRSGEPLCAMNKPMKYTCTEENRCSIWTCPTELVQPEDMEDGLCLGYHPDYCERFVVDTMLEPRRLCALPRSEAKWKDIYDMRSHGERVFSWEDHFMETNRIPFTSLDEIDYYLRMGDITQLLLGCLAQDLDFPALVLASDLPGLERKMKDEALGVWKNVPALLYTILWDLLEGVPGVSVKMSENATGFEVVTNLPKSALP